jgi:CelD/BcsL family acetyltransferase involved in cellulose biosynthesis
MAERGDTRFRIMLAWEGERLITVLPCAIRRQRGLRTLQWMAQTFSDYCDAIVDPEIDSRPVLDALWMEMLNLGGIDLVQLRCVRPDARIHRLLAREGNGLRVEDRHDQCLRIDCIWPNGEAYFRSLNKKGRNNHTRGKRILEELGGPVAFRRYGPGAEARQALERLISLKRSWLKVHDPKSPVLDVDSELLRNMLTAALDTELATIFAITSGDRLAAASLNFVHETKMQAYFTAFDPSFDRASPGTILIVEYTKWAFDHGLRQVDFLRGDESFKFRLGNAETLLDGFVGPRSLIGHAAVAAQEWRLRLRRTREAPSPSQEPALPAA